MRHSIEMSDEWHKALMAGKVDPMVVIGAGSMVLAATKPTVKGATAPIRIAVARVHGKNTRVFESSKGRTIFLHLWHGASVAFGVPGGTRSSGDSGLGG